MLRRRAALALAAWPVAGLLSGCGVLSREPAATRAAAGAEAARVPARPGSELQWARTAWRYLENNADYDTGLVPGTDRTQLLTAWNLGDQLAAIVAAHELGVIDAHEFDQRLSRLLGFLGSMELSGGMLPNKAYHAVTGKMADFGGQPRDIGWSAVDVGRLMLWLKITGQRHPRFAEYVDKVMLRFSFCEVIDDCGVLHGVARDGGQSHRYQEGRLGYEQYAGAAFALWGFDARRSVGMPRTEIANIHGVPLRYDARDPRTSGAQAPVLTLPFALMGMEIGWAPTSPVAPLRELADQVYRVQEERFRREGQFTARSDWQQRQAPYVVLDSVHAAGYAFNTIGHDGGEYEKLALVSVRAAFAMWALWPGEYTRQLIEAIRQLYDADRGWYEGRFEAGGGPMTNITLSTNAAVLQALLYRARGTLLPAGASPGLFDRRIQDVYRRDGRCWPQEREAARCTSAG